MSRSRASSVFLFLTITFVWGSDRPYRIEPLNIQPVHFVVSGNGRYLLATEPQGLVRYDLATGTTTVGGVGTYSFQVSYDGNRVAYETNGLDIYDFSTGTNTHLFTDFGLESITLSGDGNRVAFRSSMDRGANPDHSDEWFLIDIPSGEVIQLTDSLPGPVNLSSNPCAISFDGKTVCFNRDFGFRDPILGLWREGVGLVNVDQIGASYHGLSMDRDGTFVVFFSNNDLTGGNPNFFTEVYGYDIVEDQFLRLSESTEYPNFFSEWPALSYNGEYVFHVTNGNLTGQNPGSTLYRLDRQGNQIVIGFSDPYYVFANETGSRVLFTRHGELFLADNSPSVPTLSQGTLFLFIVVLALAGLRLIKMRETS